MYAVVGCTDCGNLWLLTDPRDSETARCSRCGRRHRTDRLRRFFESEDREAARQARAAMLADRGGDMEAFGTLDSVAEMERQLEGSGVDDREYLEAAGLDPDEVAAAGDVDRSGSKSRPEIVREALETLDRPTEAAVVDYAAERGVPPDAVEDLLEKLTRRGEVSEHRGRYRLV